MNRDGSNDLVFFVGFSIRASLFEPSTRRFGVPFVYDYTRIGPELPVFWADVTGDGWDDLIVALTFSRTYVIPTDDVTR